MNIDLCCVQVENLSADMEMEKMANKANSIKVMQAPPPMDSDCVITLD